MRRVAVGVAGFVLLIGCGGSDGGGAEQNPDRPIDRMIDVGGRRLHLECDGNGSPIVILEAGLTGDHRTWDAIMPEVAKSTRVCAYDRANIDPSEGAPTPRTAGDIVADLHALVGAGHLDAPYVLVGFSFGGLVSQLYASTFPDDVAGMVLIESNHPDEVDQFEAKLTPEQIKRDRDEANANPEGVDLYASYKEVQAAPSLPDRPLVVITAAKPADWPPGWDPHVFDRLRAAEQKDLVGRVSDGTQIVAKNSGHEVPSTEPTVVVKGIEAVLAKTGIN